MRFFWGLVVVGFVSQILVAQGEVPNGEFDRNSTLVAGIFQQRLDHSGQSQGQSFAQRYWFESSYASQSETAPVLFHVCGEGDVEKNYFLHDNAIEWAKTLGAHIVYLEHRFYGNSRPAGGLSTSNLRFLTLDNVIEDFADFQKWVSGERKWKGKWIAVGGSYSGTLSAIYRQRHPELVVGALASSAPMRSGADEFSSVDPDLEVSVRRQWLYQACTMFGFWQARKEKLVSPSPQLCMASFGNIPLVDYALSNQQIYFPFLSDSPAAPSNILFTYGTADTWTRLGLLPQENHNSRITIQYIGGAKHHEDLNRPKWQDTPAIKEARTLFTTLANLWLNSKAQPMLAIGQVAEVAVASDLYSGDKIVGTLAAGTKVKIAGIQRGWALIQKPEAAPFLGWILVTGLKASP